MEPLQNVGKKSPSRGADDSGFSLDIQTCKAVKVTSRVVGISPAVTMSSSFIGITPFWPIGGSIMFIRIFGLFALAISLFGIQCRAQENCFGGEGVVVSCNFSPGITEGIYDFTGTGDGRLVVDFVTVLPPGFTLTVTVNHNIDHLAPGVFPHNTMCVQYAPNGFRCDQYDFSGNAHGPNGVPVKNKDYKGLITLTLSYFTAQT